MGELENNNYACTCTLDISDSAPGAQVIVLPKAELDGANKDTKHYPSNFEVCVRVP